MVVQDPTRTYEALMENITVRHHPLGTSTIGEAGMGRANAATAAPPPTMEEVTTVIRVEIAAAHAATKMPTNRQRITGRRHAREFKPTKYCWTHGYTTSRDGHGCN